MEWDERCQVVKINDFWRWNCRQPIGQSGRSNFIQIAPAAGWRIASASWPSGTDFDHSQWFKCGLELAGRCHIAVLHKCGGNLRGCRRSDQPSYECSDGNNVLSLETVIASVLLREKSRGQSRLFLLHEAVPTGFRIAAVPAACY